MNKVQLKQKIALTPSGTGIYLFINNHKKALYVGKALSLKKRLDSYRRTEDPRILRMLSEAKRIDLIETNSEIEALILESQYIKKYKPEFNIMLRDDKQFFYVEFSTDKFPKIFLTHKPINLDSRSMINDSRKSSIHNSKISNHKSTYIGPFTDAGALKVTLRLLRKIFPYCTCKQKHNSYCLNYHIGKCLGYCCLTREDSRIMIYDLRIYQKNIKAIRDVLSGKKESVIRQFEKKMKNFAKEEKFEEARGLQYKIEKLKKIFQNAQILNTRYLSLDTNGDSTKNALNQLTELINAKRPLKRIEAYDIANIQGNFAVGAMIVFSDGVPDKNEYRKFKIRTKSTPDDTTMLKEVLTRRFNHPEWQYPDLILVDGGRQQLSVAQKVIFNLKFTIFNEFSIKQLPKIIAITKNKRHIGEKIFVQNKKDPIPLSGLPTNVKNLLLQINAEAHRFAISYYRKTHRKQIPKFTQ